MNDQLSTTYFSRVFASWNITLGVVHYQGCLALAFRPYVSLQRHTEELWSNGLFAPFKLRYHGTWAQATFFRETDLIFLFDVHVLGDQVFKAPHLLNLFPIKPDVSEMWASPFAFMFALSRGSAWFSHCNGDVNFHLLTPLFYSYWMLVASSVPVGIPFWSQLLKTPARGF